jgi:ribosomal protein S18 acetylase RimI-like enzyme
LAKKHWEVSDLGADQLPRASEMLGRAFQNDPALRFLVPEGARRARLAPSLLGGMARYCWLYGEVYATRGLEGIACWLPPGEPLPGFSPRALVRVSRAGLLADVPRLGWEGLGRLLRWTRYTDELHPRLAPGPHWYLWLLGVEPSQQGTGVGTALLRPALARADGEGVPCYLETQNERNLRFYRKQGFRVVSDGEVPGHGLRVWTMLREPRGAHE